MSGSMHRWTELAQRYRPNDESTFSREARQLARLGLTERDIGAALRLDPSTTHRLLGAKEKP